MDGRVAEMAPFDETTLVLALVKEKGSWWSQIKERSGTGYRIGAISEEPNSVLYLHSTVLFYCTLEVVRTSKARVEMVVQYKSGQM